MPGHFGTLDTKHFENAISMYSNFSVQFKDIVKAVNSSAATMVSNWEGSGCKAFDSDYKQVQLNLNDISDIMDNILEALKNAHEEYKGADNGLASGYDSALSGGGGSSRDF